MTVGLEVEKKELSLDDVISKLSIGSKAQIRLWEYALAHSDSKKGYAHQIASLLIQEVVCKIPEDKRPSDFYCSVLRKYNAI